MKRRDFIKGMGVATLGLAGGQLFRGFPLAHAAPANFDPGSIRFSARTANQVPRYINIFLYGGPSELAGNLTNIADISANSQNAYPGSVLSSVTANGFWSAAGGDVMESLLASGDMTIYRTMHRVKSDTKSHGTSVTQNLLGSLNTDSPGIATTLAWILEQNNPFAKPIGDLLFPIVSFEGESPVFNSGDLNVNTTLKPVALNSNLQNPYQRTNSGSSYPYGGDATDQALESLAAQMNDISDIDKITDSFIQRGNYAAQINNMLSSVAIDDSLTSYGLSTDHYANTNFGRRLKAAVSLALANPETVFISLGSGGLGGWDDHSEALNNYPNRMSELMTAVQAAITHINAAAANGVGHADNIIINIYGDFGRNVNLNNSIGWDHGNNQNLYTFGGRGIAGRGLGKIVGRTQRVGSSGVNRQFTAPASGSYQFEPFALASTIYHNFGVVNPELITGEAPINENAPSEV
jgi:hypothetical protein